MPAEKSAVTKLIIRERRIEADDYIQVPDDAPLPSEAPVIVSHARWLEQREALIARTGRLGVRFPSTVDPGASPEDLQRLTVVAIEFPAFKDGRGYSYARTLRNRHGYTGEIRAVGDVLRDQLLYMARCGFNAFEVRSDRSIEDALRAFDEFSVDYQPNFPPPHSPGAPDRSDP